MAAGPLSSPQNRQSQVIHVRVSGIHWALGRETSSQVLWMPLGILGLWP